MVYKLRQIKSSGFTLIEMLVVIAIIGIMSSVIIAGALRRANSESAVRFSLEQIQATLEQAREYAEKGKTVVVGASVAVPNSGYGVTMNVLTGEIKLFGAFDTGPNQTVSEQKFSSGFSLSGRLECRQDAPPHTVQTGLRSITLIFHPVDGSIVLSDPSLSCAEIYIEGKSADGTVLKNLVIRPATKVMYVE